MPPSVCLPTGLWIDGRHCRAATVHPVPEGDESILLDHAQGVPARRVTELLARFVELDDADGDSRGLARRLTVGDRESLLLHLRRATFGDDFACTLPCAFCGKQMDLSLRVQDLLLPPYEDPRPAHEISLEDGGQSFRIRFRLPSGGAQEAAAEVSADLGVAAQSLLRECVDSIEVDGNVVEGGCIPDTVAEQVAQAMAELDPQAEIELDLVCPECQQPGTAIFDTASVFLRELDAQAQILLREVHVLALRYHWSEGDILALPRPRRQRYLALPSAGG